MSLEPPFPLEFLVSGVPVSHQNKGRRSLDEWKALVRDGYSDQLAEGHWATTESVFVAIYYFPDGAMEGDVDNIVKPILDAMNGDVYLDDRQVERITVQKFEPGRVLTFVDPSETLARALEWDRPVVYIRIDVEESLGRSVGLS